MVSGSGSLPGPTSPQASRPVAGGMTVQPYFSSKARLSWVTGLSSMWVFMAGAMSRGQRQASRVVLSMSSARPWASLAQMLAVAGATITRSARSARAMCSTSFAVKRSKVSV